MGIKFLKKFSRKVLLWDAKFRIKIESICILDTIKLHIKLRLVAFHCGHNKIPFPDTISGSVALPDDEVAAEGSHDPADPTPMVSPLGQGPNRTEGILRS